MKVMRLSCKWLSCDLRACASSKRDRDGAQIAIISLAYPSAAFPSSKPMAAHGARGNGGGSVRTRTRPSRDARRRRQRRCAQARAHCACACACALAWAWAWASGLALAW
eukprot:6180245-Pleurochrysis_carterae.AAC.2